MIKIFVKGIRMDRKISARKLCDLSGISKTHILNIEQGGTSPTIECLCKLAFALKVDVHELFSYDNCDDFSCNEHAKDNKK